MTPIPFWQNDPILVPAASPRKLSEIVSPDLFDIILDFSRQNPGRVVNRLGDPMCADCWDLLAQRVASNLPITGDVVRQVLGMPTVKRDVYEATSRTWVGICSWEFLDDDGADCAGAGYVLFGADKLAKQIIPPPFLKIESR